MRGRARPPLPDQIIDSIALPRAQATRSGRSSSSDLIPIGDSHPYRKNEAKTAVRPGGPSGASARSPIHREGACVPPCVLTSGRFRAPFAIARTSIIRPRPHRVHARRADASPQAVDRVAWRDAAFRGQRLRAQHEVKAESLVVRQCSTHAACAPAPTAESRRRGGRRLHLRPGGGYRRGPDPGADLGSDQAISGTSESGRCSAGGGAASQRGGRDRARGRPHGGEAPLSPVVRDA